VSYIALCLVLLAAVTHACWNLSAKHAAQSRHFVWLFSAGSVLVYGPIVLGVLWVEQPQFTARHWLSLAGTSVLHLLYSLSLQRGYRVSDLSVVYPIAQVTLDKPLADFDEPVGLPTTWLIDPQGKVAAHIVGPVTAASLAKAIGVE